ncbi:uncharacterized protein LOC111871037 [Cryptotermes secundus]|uniref:uncharacterized protein LOC111871037 n=1 Tax=Cryptotermes secundus TaxID=105785 RepID=UPI001454E42E|nr:uncharacterized protein LOC111871037 [Cryptotermes secundus]
MRKRTLVKFVMSEHSKGKHPSRQCRVCTVHKKWIRECDQQRAKWLPKSFFEHRDGHPRATHVNVRILASPSKHGTVPSGSSGMIGKLGAPHHEHRYLCPMFPDTVQVTQAPTRQP